MKSVAVLSQPPIPMRCLSANASAALRHGASGGVRRLRGCSCWKQRLSHANANMLSCLRCNSERLGSARRTHWCLCEGGTRGTSALLKILMAPLQPPRVERCEAARTPMVWRRVWHADRGSHRRTQKDVQAAGAILCSVPAGLRKSV